MSGRPLDLLQLLSIPEILRSLCSDMISKSPNGMLVRIIFVNHLGTHGRRRRRRRKIAAV